MGSIYMDNVSQYRVHPREDSLGCVARPACFRDSDEMHKEKGGGDDGKRRRIRKRYTAQRAHEHRAD